MAKDPYEHRKYRQKYKLGYGAEGASRGKGVLGDDIPDVNPQEAASKDPRKETDEAEAKKKSSGEESKGDHAPGQLSRTRPTVIKTQKSKTRPNPY